MTTTNPELLQEIRNTKPIDLTEKQKQYLRSITSVDWSKVSLEVGNRACALLGEDPRIENGKRIIIGLSLVPYFRARLSPELLPMINQVIDSWCDEGMKMLVVLGTDTELDEQVAYNRAMRDAQYDTHFFDPELDD